MWMQGGVRRLAELIAGFALALELSLLAALASGHFVASHEKLGRKRPERGLKDSHLNREFFSQCLGERGTLVSWQPIKVCVCVCVCVCVWCVCVCWVCVCGVVVCVWCGCGVCGMCVVCGVCVHMCVVSVCMCSVWWVWCVCACVVWCVGVGVGVCVCGCVGVWWACVGVWWACVCERVRENVNGCRESQPIFIPFAPTSSTQEAAFCLS